MTSRASRVVPRLRKPAGHRRAHAIVGLGVDLLEVGRVRRELALDRAGFIRQVFTAAESAHCESMRYPARHFAARMAAKEAVFKALALESGDMSGWRRVEIHAGGQALPRVVLRGHLKQLAEHRGVRRVWLSMSHTPNLATASVILES